MTDQYGHHGIHLFKLWLDNKIMVNVEKLNVAYDTYPGELKNPAT